MAKVVSGIFFIDTLNKDYFLDSHVSAGRLEHQLSRGRSEHNRLWESMEAGRPSSVLYDRKRFWSSPLSLIPVCGRSHSSLVVLLNGKGLLEYLRELRRTA